MSENEKLREQIKNNDIWIANFDGCFDDGNGILGYYYGEKRAWDSCIRYFVEMKQYRVSKHYDYEKEKWEFSYYTSLYQYFSVEKMVIK